MGLVAAGAMTAVAFCVLAINILSYRRFPNDRFIRPAIAISALACAIMIAFLVLQLIRK
jgi:hypothetical protein